MPGRSLNIKVPVICIKDLNTQTHPGTTQYVYCLVIMAAWAALKNLHFGVYDSLQKLTTWQPTEGSLFKRRNCRLPLISVLTSVYPCKRHQFLLKKMPSVSCTLTGTQQQNKWSINSDLWDKREMLDVGCEIFSSHFIFEADFRGSTTRQQVIHTPMHSITLEIEACMLACQTRAGHGVRGLICCRCFIGSVISFYASVITPCSGMEMFCSFGCKNRQRKMPHMHTKSGAHENISQGTREWKNWQKVWSVLYTSRQDTCCLKDAHPLHLMKLKWRLVTMFLKCIKYWVVKLPLWD